MREDVVDVHFGIHGSRVNRVVLEEQPTGKFRFPYS